MNPDDPKFTAHALGEMEDLTPAERAEIEALLAGDPAAAAEADEMRAIAARLRAELSGEAAGALDENQRAAVFNAATSTAPEEKIVRFSWRRVLKIAAIFIVFAVLLGVISPGLFVNREQARLAAEYARLSTDQVRMAPAELQTSDDLRGLVASNLQKSFPKPEREVAEALPMPPVEQSQTAPLSVFADASAKAEQFKEKADIAWSGPARRYNNDSNAPLVTDPQAAAELQLQLQEKMSELKSGRALASTGTTPVQERPAALPALPVPSSTPVAATDPTSKERADEVTKNRSYKSLGLASAASRAAPARGTVETASGPSAGLAADRADSSKVAFNKAPAATTSPAVTTKKYGEETYDVGGYEIRRRGGMEIPDPQSALAFDELAENAFLAASDSPLSTFSIDVDTASYSMVRRFLNNNQQPPKGAVRIEELLNYFTYDYAPPKGEVPFSAAMEVAACPWTPEHRLVRIALKGRDMDKDRRPASNLVFLVDVSGSMTPENKLPLLKRSLALLVEELGDEDKVAIVVYAGNSGCVLEPTNDKRKMQAALRNLEAGGSTNGGSGVQLAYQLAAKSFIKGGTNRVILATDGDWNVGITDRNELVDLIKRKAKTGVFLTVLGVGMDNLKDATLVKLADSGNGNYAYLDTVAEARKVLVQQLSGTLVTIAKDVKIQVEFNPAQVGAYRLVGYEKRILAKEDFNNDKKDAGEIGAGHTVTALYEVVPAGQEAIVKRKGVDSLKYQPGTAAAASPAEGKEAPVELKNDPSEAFLDAYTAVQQAEKAEQAGDLRQAFEKFQYAAKVLAHITKMGPEWNPQILVYRTKRTGDALARVKESLQRAGQTATATPRIAPEDAEKQLVERALVEPRKTASKEMLTLKLRYKEPEGDTSKLLEFPLIDGGTPWEKSSGDFRFAAAVAGYGMLLRESQYRGDASWSTVEEWAEEGKGNDPSGYRAEFLTLVHKARAVCR